MPTDSDQPPASSARLRHDRALWDALVDRCGLAATLGQWEPSADPAADRERVMRSGEEDARLLLPFVHPDAVVLDIGCGAGRVMRPLARHAREVVGVDLAPAMIGLAREYLAGVDNARVFVGDGASLAGIEDGSVDFAFSLHTLTHVDRRSAFRYLREIKRVLAPGGRALLQFLNLLHARGFEHFQAVLDSDHPVEFYTPEELRFLMRSVGLEIHKEHQNLEFIELTVLKGRVDAWVKEWRQGFRVEIAARRGFFAEDGGDVASDGEFTAVLVNSTDAWRAAEFASSVHRRHGGRTTECAYASAVVYVPARSQAEVVVRHRGSDGALSLSIAAPNAPLLERRTDPRPEAGRVEAHLAVIPSGFRWSDETARLFPTCGHAWPLPRITSP